jgi:hypothetical protein
MVMAAAAEVEVEENKIHYHDEVPADKKKSPF